MPRNVALPFVMGSKNEYPPLAGLYDECPAQFDPVYTDFSPRGTKQAPEVRPGPDFRTRSSASIPPNRGTGRR